MIYRTIDPRMWDDEWFADLSVEAKLLWILILTGPHTTSLPGLSVCGPAALAESARMDPEIVADRLQELLRKPVEKGAPPRLEYDPKRRVLRVPNAPRYNPPGNPNVLKGWWRLWSALPESPLKYKHISSLKDSISQQEAPLFRSIWATTFGAVPQTLSEPSRKPSERVPQTLSEPFRKPSERVPQTLLNSGSGSGSPSQSGSFSSGGQPSAATRATPTLDPRDRSGEEEEKEDHQDSIQENEGGGGEGEGEGGEGREEGKVEGTPSPDPSDSDQTLDPDQPDSLAPLIARRKEADKAKATAAASDKATKERAQANLKGAVESPRQQAASTRLEMLWKECWAECFPTLPTLPWGAKERGMVRTMMERLSEDALADVIRYALYRWEHINKAFFKGQGRPPTLGFVMKFHEQFHLDATRYLNAMVVVKEWRAAVVASRGQSVPDELGKRYDAARTELASLGKSVDEWNWTSEVSSGSQATETGPA